MSKPKTDTVAVMTDKQAVLLRELAIALMSLRLSDRI
jgi:hypothetical protein